MNLRPVFSTPRLLAAGASLCVIAAAVPLAAQTPAPAPAPTLPSSITAAAPMAVPEPQVREGVAAVVNDEVVSTYDLRQRVIWLVVSTGTPLTEENLPQIQTEALRSLIDERLQSQELRKQERTRKMKPGTLFASEADVDEYLQGMAEQNQFTTEQFLRELEGRGITRKAIRDQVQVNLSWQQWTRGYYGRRVRVSDDQIQTVERQITASANKPSFLVSEIFIDASRAGGVQQAVASANQVLAQLQQGARFENLARQYSSLPSAASGGDAGWLTAGELDPSLGTILEQMRPGQATRPITVSEGAYIVLLRDKRAGGGTTMVTLKQAAVSIAPDAPESDVQAAQTKLMAVKARFNGCVAMEQAASQVSGVEVTDLGETATPDLAPVFRTAVEPLEKDQISEPVRTGVGLHLVAVCDKKASTPGMPSRDQIENRLFSDQMAMLQRRELRNLRNAATISQPQ